MHHQTGTGTAIQFDLADVSVGDLLPTIPAAQIDWPTIGRIEANAVSADRVVAIGRGRQSGEKKQRGGNHLFNTIKLAYDCHYPLVLSPDHIWLTIAQGFSQHVNADSERLRKKFVAHEGKIRLSIDTPGIKESPWTPWHQAVKDCFDTPAGIRDQLEDQIEAMGGRDESALDQFVDELRKRVKGEVVDTLMPTFSTTTINSHAAMAITSMATFQSYFEYFSRTLCGIPSVTLLGESDDWQAIRERAGRLGNYDTDFWLPHLLPVLDRFAESANGNPDLEFWNSIIQVDGDSGGPYISGWINTLFPYLVGGFSGEQSQNQHMDWRYCPGGAVGNQPDSYPWSNAICPFTWDYYGTRYKMEFAAGIVGTSQDPATRALQPEIGWAVADVSGN